MFLPIKRNVQQGNPYLYIQMKPLLSSNSHQILYTILCQQASLSIMFSMNSISKPSMRATGTVAKNSESLYWINRMRLGEFFSSISQYNHSTFLIHRAFLLRDDAIHIILRSHIYVIKNIHAALAGILAKFSMVSSYLISCLVKTNNKIQKESLLCCALQ